MKNLLFAFAFTLFFSFTSHSQESLGNKNAFESFANTRGTEVPVFHTKESTKGSQYLFGEWKPGYAINSQGQVVKEPGLSFNYDKLYQNLYMTKDMKTSYILDNSSINDVFITDNSSTIVLHKVNIDGKDALVKVLVDNPAGFSVYRSLTTKFLPSNYVSTGLTESGHNYDEYSEIPTYYVYSKSYGLKALPNKRKALKDFFKDNSKANSYLKDNMENDFNELFFINLGNSLNN